MGVSKRAPFSFSPGSLCPVCKWFPLSCGTHGQAIYNRETVTWEAVTAARLASSGAGCCAPVVPRQLL